MWGCYSGEAWPGCERLVAFQLGRLVLVVLGVGRAVREADLHVLDLLVVAQGLESLAAEETRGVGALDLDVLEPYASEAAAGQAAEEDLAFVEELQELDGQGALRARFLRTSDYRL